MALSRVLLIGPLLLLLLASALSLDAKAPPPPLPIVLSGAGPAALVFAHRFLRLTSPQQQGNGNGGVSPALIIFEKRPRPQRHVDSKTLCVAGDSAFGFGVSQKSQIVLGKTPGLLEAVQAISQPTAFAPGIELSIVNRREMCAEMLYELEKEYGASSNVNDERLQIHFETAVTDLDQDNKVVTVKNVVDNTTQQVPYSILIAADGANSVIRSKLIEHGDLQCERYYSDSSWKALQLPEQPNLDASTFERYPKPFVKSHKFLKKDNGAIIPRFENRFVLLNFRGPPSDGDYEYIRVNNPFDAKTPQELKTAIAQVLPNVTNFPDDEILQTFLNQKPGRESYMKLDKHYVPHGTVVLMGDASVGMYSLFGQGAASAMTQADALAEMLATTIASTASAAVNTNNDTIQQQQQLLDLQEKALLRYSNSSVIEGHAISDLNLLQHVLRKRGPLKFWALFQMMGIGKTLTNTPEIPYSDILQKKKRAIWFSKLFWRRARIAAPPPPTTTNSKTP